MLDTFRPDFPTCVYSTTGSCEDVISTKNDYVKHLLTKWKGYIWMLLSKPGRGDSSCLQIIEGVNQGNRGYSGNQKNAIQGQRPDTENRHTQQRT